MHLQKLNKNVAVKMVLAREIETFAASIKPAVRPKKKTGDTSFALDSRVMLLSFMDSPKDIPVIADIYDLKLTSPDWMMEFISASELEDPTSLDKVKMHVDAMKPKLGACLVMIDAAKELSPKKFRKKSARCQSALIRPGFSPLSTHSPFKRATSTATCASGLKPIGVNLR